MARGVAREVLVQMVFEYLFLEKRNDMTLSSLCEESRLMKNDIDFVNEIYTGIIENIDLLKEDIKNTVKDFSFSQVVKLDLAILLIAMYELKFTELDKPIIINEALNLAKKFSTDKSTSFINGVLSSATRAK